MLLNYNFLRTFLNICNQFSREKVSAQMAREITLAIFKIVGWVALEAFIYQGNSVLSKRKKREYYETPGTFLTIYYAILVFGVTIKPKMYLTRKVCNLYQKPVKPTPLVFKKS